MCRCWEYIYLWLLYLLDILTPLLLYNSLLFLVAIFALKSILSNRSMAIPTFFWLPLLNYHLPPLPFEPVFVFGTEMSLLKATYVGSCFLIHLATLCLFIGKLLIYENLPLQFYLLFYGCFVSPLFLFPCVSVYLLRYLLSWWFSMMICWVSPFLFHVFALDFCFVVTSKFV